MPRYSAEQIYAFARRAGFSPDESATMTAIALAESGGNSRAHNPYGEDSRGLWQINARAHPDLAQRYDLYDPAQNAQAAFSVSRGGADVSPWTVTHGGNGARYLRHREDAEQAAVAFGDGPGHGVWTGTAGYGHKLPAGDSDDDGGAAPRTVAQQSQPDQGGNEALDRFLEAARAQVGDTYVFGGEAKLNDPDPEVFDCSELTQWAAHQAGVKIPDGATAQYMFLKERGMLIPVDEAKNTPGALLFNFDREPRPGDGRTPGAHVAISLGNGKTVEARNSRDDVDEFTAGDRFKFAAVIPGISDGTATPTSAAPDPAPLPPLEPVAAEAPLVVPPELGGADSDRDGLTDAMERRLGLDPRNADTDGDNLGDAYEMVTTRTDPRRADSDNDRLNDAFELARGLDPRSPDTDGDGHLDGTFALNQPDADGDKLDDALEAALGLNPSLADSDADGFSDALEVQAGSNALDARSTPLTQLADQDDADVDPAPGA
jgi:cell wall-associated NlpC family hydrolase